MATPTLTKHSLPGSLGEILIKPKGGGLLRTKLVRYLIIHVLPFPKGAPTALR